MISFIFIGLLVLVILFQAAQYRALRTHTSIMTVVHADFSHLVDEVKKLKGEKSDS